MDSDLVEWWSDILCGKSGWHVWKVVDVGPKLLTVSCFVPPSLKLKSEKGSSWLLSSRVYTIITLSPTYARFFFLPEYVGKILTSWRRDEVVQTGINVVVWWARLLERWEFTVTLWCDCVVNALQKCVSDTWTVMSGRSTDNTIYSSVVDACGFWLVTTFGSQLVWKVRFRSYSP